MVLAPTSQEAMKIANRAFARFKDSLYYLWKKYDIPIPPVFPAETFEGIHAIGHFYAGHPAGAREWVARHRDLGGINYMALETCFGDMTLQEALRSGTLLPRDAAAFAHRNVLMQALGTGVAPKVGVTLLSARRGDVLLLCTDGLWNYMAATDELSVMASKVNLLGERLRGAQFAGR